MRGNAPQAQGQGSDSQGGNRQGGPAKRRNSQGQGKEYTREYYSNGR